MLRNPRISRKNHAFPPGRWSQFSTQFLLKLTARVVNDVLFAKPYAKSATISNRPLMLRVSVLKDGIFAKASASFSALPVIVQRGMLTSTVSVVIDFCFDRNSVNSSTQTAQLTFTETDDMASPEIFSRTSLGSCNSSLLGKLFSKYISPVGLSSTHAPSTGQK